MSMMRRLLILLTATVLVLPAANAAGAQRLYVAGAAPGEFRVAGSSVGSDGALAQIDSASAGTDPLLGSAISPDGRNLYVASAGSGLRSFGLAENGSVTPAAGDAGPANLLGVVVTPDGRFVYAVEGGAGGGVRAWSRGSDGVLTTLGAGSDYAGATGIAIAPDGRHLFATSLTAGTVRPFTIGTDGALTPGAALPAGANPVSTAISPDGRFLYVGSMGGDAIRTYAIAADGSLSQVGGSQPTAGTGPYDLLVTPDGHYLYVANVGTGGIGGIGRFTLAADGSPTMGIPDVPTNGSPMGLAVNSAGKWLYANDSSAPQVFGFSLAGAVPTALAGSPFDVGVEGQLGGSVALTPDRPPVAAFTTAVNNRRVSFDALGTSDPDGDLVGRYDWDFGDGTTAANGGAQLTRRYGKGKKHPPVTLTVADDSGCSTAFVSAGHTPYCNGSDAATVTMTPFAPKFLGKPRQRAARVVKLRLRCPAECRVKVVGRVKLSGKGVRAKKTKVKGTSKRLRAGQKRTLKLRLSERGVRLAGEATQAVARLKVSATDDAGNLFKDRHGIRLR
ncbi:MAG: beta-propeller fold lactonase family protein [Solirubrobacterales bacterium]|nr:beta-propeller fold lactonase family protein [Solirubrobacterales bacterium]MCB8971706.1 beta-propeller fold lactonase family protein [Thermoleophilales bacterium]